MKTGIFVSRAQSRTPVKLAFKEGFRKKDDALRREIQIRGLSKRSKLLLCARHPLKSRHSLRWLIRTT